MSRLINCLSIFEIHISRFLDLCHIALCTDGENRFTDSTCTDGENRFDLPKSVDLLPATMIVTECVDSSKRIPLIIRDDII